MPEPEQPYVPPGTVHRYGTPPGAFVPPAPNPPVPPQSQRRTGLIVGLVVVVTALVASTAVLVTLLVTGDADEDPTVSAATTPTPKNYTEASQIIRDLTSTGLVGRCKPENPVSPAVSQQRCETHDDQLIVIVFPDSSAVEGRIAWSKDTLKGTGIGAGALVRGPNWLVNVGDFDGPTQKSVSLALHGELVIIPD